MAKQKTATRQAGKRNGNTGKRYSRPSKNRIGSFLLVIQALVSLVFMGVVFLLDMLPANYLALAAMVLFFLWCLAFMSQALRKKRGVTGKIYSLLLICVLIYGAYHIMETNNMIAKITSGGFKKEYDMKKILYITFLLFCACYISSCSEDRYYPGEIYQDVDDNGGDDGDDVVEKVNENLAKGGTVLSGSEQDADHGPNLLVNGLIQGNEEYFGTFQTGVDHEEWVQIKLIQKQKINSIWLYPRAANEGFPKDFKLEISTDAKDWTTVVEKTGYDATTADPQKFDFEPVVALYVRLTATKLAIANNMWTNYQDVYYIQLKEIEVYLSDGSSVDPDPDPDPEPDPNEPNMALGGFVQAISEEAGHEVSFLVDGDFTNSNLNYFGTASSSSDEPQWVNVKLTREDDFNEIWLYPKYGGEAVDGFPIDFKLMVSLDGAEWTEVVSKTDYPVPAYTPDTPQPEVFSFETVHAGYVKIVATKLFSTSNMWTGWQTVYLMQFAEMCVYKK